MKKSEILRLGLRFSKDDVQNLLENSGRVRDSLILSSETQDTSEKPVGNSLEI